MGMLHTVNKSPFQANSLSTCLRYAKAGSSVLLIEDGVYAARAGSKVADEIKSAMSDKAVYALEPDLKARGIDSNLIDGIKLIDYAGFVDLTAESESVQSWL